MSPGAEPRARHLRQPGENGRRRLREELRVAVVGGGIAGVAAATVLVERGARVTLIERERWLGGRAGAWTDRLSDGTPFEMERGFHAFFRQYYNLRALIRRIDPALSILSPLEDYPILGPGGRAQSFAGLPRQTPWNIVALTWRSPAVGLDELRRVNVGRAARMLAYDPATNLRDFDGMSAAAYLDSLNFPPDARRLLFDVFAHSFFNPEEEMSAAELLMMFHFYFTGNPEGLVFDVSRRPFSHALWNPFARRLEAGGCELRLGATALSVSRAPSGEWTVRTDAGGVTADAVVLATTVPALQSIVAASQGLGPRGWRERVASLQLTRPFAVWRLWLDRPVAPGRSPFVGTTGVGRLDNISLYHLFEDESREWVMRHGGSIVELHAYGLEENPDETEVRRDLREGMETFYPELAGARVREERWLLLQDCPAFRTGTAGTRLGVDAPIDDLVVAGDHVELGFPSALMERAAASGFLAANRILLDRGVAPEPVLTVAARGMLAGVGA